ncbi:hypothetical protein ISN45_Aa01g025190 [Arabidopsis thaliana x Arabidopsis arenosa]|uniref:Transmembrane protein n=1 Tax=Arabidopsis thaliana x Arabidopsis arenosa TaxID=1240361 RepID=A0A8T2C375_9BRAS|nr:hypothetical protein ISN45_Aa01g025190 [Arabidopsis thaliana x Arabidopsis arenosa]
MDTENDELGQKIEICRDTSTAETESGQRETCGFYNDHSMSKKKKLSTAIILLIVDGVKANSLAVLTEARGTSALRFCLLCHLHLLLVGILDLTCTLIFPVLAVARTLSTTRKLLDILMETAPREIDCSRLAEGL